MRPDRRQILRAAAALLLPALGAAPRVAGAQGRTFAPPASPMLYTRHLERGLSGGASFSVSRSFAVRFIPEQGGYRVDGEQVEVAVDAPASLAHFATLERQRQERALFPLLLDGNGLIELGPELAGPPRLDEAVREALGRIAQLPTTERAELTRFVTAVHANAAQLLTELPRDLFAPDRPHSSESRTLVLPDGGEGLVTVSYMAETEPATGLMRRARREVVTDIDGTLRRTQESWTLERQ